MTGVSGYAKKTAALSREDVGRDRNLVSENAYAAIARSIGERSSDPSPHTALDAVTFSMVRRRQVALYSRLLIALLVTCASPAVDASLLDRLIARTEIDAIKVAPDGQSVAFLTHRLDAITDRIEYQLFVQPAAGRNDRTLIGMGYASFARRDTTHPPNASAAWPKNQATTIDFLWSPDSSGLLYTLPTEQGMQLRLWKRSTRMSSTLTSGHFRIHIAKAAGQSATVVAVNMQRASTKNSRPVDRALRIKDSFGFLGPLVHPKPELKHHRRTYRFDWQTQGLTKLDARMIDSPERPLEAEPETFARSPDGKNYIWAPRAGGWSLPSPNGRFVAVYEAGILDARSVEKARHYGRIAIFDAQGTKLTATKDNPRATRNKTILGWNGEGTEVFFLEQYWNGSAISALHLSGSQRSVYNDSGLLEISTFAAGTRVATDAVDSETTFAIVVRSTNLRAWELVRIDLPAGQLTVLYSPNQSLDVSSIASVRFIEIDDRYHGRLYLPLGARGPIPLVFVTYAASSGFAIAYPGDELPILALVESGIAVFSLQAMKGHIINSNDGDFCFELARAEGPLRAMERLARELADEGITDLNRVGYSGLSYGSFIGSYSYWRSALFRTLSVHWIGPDPLEFLVNGVNFSITAERRGYKDAVDEQALRMWRQISPGLNARADLPPLLLQTPDAETNGSVDSYVRLRRAGAQIEWYDYPSEGHVKQWPANKWWVYARNLDWFRFWLQDVEDPAPEKKEQYVRWRDTRSKWESALRSR